MSDTVFRLRWKILGGHTHVRVFAGAGPGALGKCGDLIFRNNEWDDFLREIYRTDSAITVLPEET